MLWLWILVGFAVFMVLLCLLRLHLQADFGKTASLVLRIGPIPVQLIPGSKRAKQKPPQTPSATAGSLRERFKAFPRPTAADLRDAWQTLGPVAKKALRRTRRGIQIHPLTVSVILGGREDPAHTAEYYGYAHAAVWSVMPVLEQLVKIPDPSIHIGMNFDAVATEFRGSVGIRIRIGTLLLLSLGIPFPTLRWILKYLKRKKTNKTMSQQPTGSPAA